MKIIPFTLLNQFQKPFFLFLGVALLLQPLYSQTVFTTATDGPWGNGATWVGGVAPSQIVFGFDVQIQHNVTACGLVRNGTLNTITIGSGASLTQGSCTPGNELWLIASGYIENNGHVETNVLTITAPPGRYANYGTTTVNDSVYISGGDLDIYNNMTINGNLTMNNGNVYVYPNSGLLIYGDFTLTNGASARNVAASACLAITGNMTVSATSVVGGSGGVVVNNTLTNSIPGNWATTVTWCALGAAFNMPTAPDCDSATAVCFAALPAQEASLSAVYTHEGTVRLNWVIPENEERIENFILERGSPATELLELAFLSPEEVKGHFENQYHWTDRSPQQGQSIYRLSYRDELGQKRTLDVAYVDVLAQDLSEYRFMIAPLPAHKFVGLQYKVGRTMKADIKIVTLVGQVVHKAAIEMISGEGKIRIEPDHLPQGTYIMQIKTDDGRVENLKMVTR